MTNLVAIEAFLTSVAVACGPSRALLCAEIIKGSMSTAGSPELCALSMMNIMAILGQTNTPS